MVPDAADAAAIRGELERGGYVPLTLEPRKLTPNTELRWAVPRLSLTWRRKEIRWEGHPESGEWPVYSDRVAVTCSVPGRKGVKPRAKTTVVFATRDAENDEPNIKVYAIPGGRYFVLLYDTSWGIEGNSGGSTRAYRVDGVACAVVGGR
jgi:hypothetical protein